MVFAGFISYLIDMTRSVPCQFSPILAITVALVAVGRLGGEVTAEAPLSGVANDFSSSSLSVDSPIEKRPLYTKGVVKVVFKNGEAHPAEVHFQLVVDESLTAKPSEKRSNVPAGEAVTVEFQLVSLQARPPLEVPLSTLEYSITYALPEGEKKIEGSREVAVGTLWVVHKASRAITIDGEFRDWGWLPREFTKPAEFQPSERGGQWRNRLDGSAKYQALHDDKTLYLALEVWDDSVWVRKDHDAWESDGVVIWCDVVPGGISTGEPWFVINPGQRETNTEIVPLARAPNGVLAAAKLTSMGYNVELALPISYFETLVREEVKRGRRTYLRLNFAINDIDQGDEAPVSLCWQPLFLGENDHGATGLVVFGSRTKEEAARKHRAEIESNPGIKKKRRN